MADFLKLSRFFTLAGLPALLLLPVVLQAQPLKSSMDPEAEFHMARMVYAGGAGRRGRGGLGAAGGPSTTRRQKSTSMEELIV